MHPSLSAGPHGRGKRRLADRPDVGSAIEGTGGDDRPDRRGGRSAQRGTVTGVQEDGPGRCGTDLGAVSRTSGRIAADSGPEPPATPPLDGAERDETLHFLWSAQLLSALPPMRTDANWVWPDALAERLLFGGFRPTRTAGASTRRLVHSGGGGCGGDAPRCGGLAAYAAGDSVTHSSRQPTIGHDGCAHRRIELDGRRDRRQDVRPPNGATERRAGMSRMERTTP